MPNGERVPPTEENLGMECYWWNEEQGCIYPKLELTSRGLRCRGIVDQVCLYVKDGREPVNPNVAELEELGGELPPLRVVRDDTP